MHAEPNFQIYSNFPFRLFKQIEQTELIGQNSPETVSSNLTTCCYILKLLQGLTMHNISFISKDNKITSIMLLAETFLSVA